MTDLLAEALRCHPDDSVGIALAPLVAGQVVRINGHAIVLLDAIAAGHKFALREHHPGDSAMRYGEPIGLVTQAIAPGAHVHTHNLATALEGERRYSPDAAPQPSIGAAQLDDWLGYARTDGRFATRNEVWLIPTVGCVAPLAEMAAREAWARHAGRIDGIVGFGHPHGCSQLGDDLAGTRAALAALCDNPNAGGVVLIGLGCESNQLSDLLAAVPARSRAKVRVLRAQDACDELAEVMALVDDLVDELAPLRRDPGPGVGAGRGIEMRGIGCLFRPHRQPLGWPVQ